MIQLRHIFYRMGCNQHFLKSVWRISETKPGGRVETSCRLSAFAGESPSYSTDLFGEGMSDNRSLQADGVCRKKFFFETKSSQQKRTGWWQLKYFFIFIHTWGRWTHFDEHIFQRGWFNHQPEKDLESWRDRFFPGKRAGGMIAQLSNFLGSNDNFLKGHIYWQQRIQFAAWNFFCIFWYIHFQVRTVSFREGSLQIVVCHTMNRTKSSSSFSRSWG